jgi:TatD DNase family protein
MKYFDVHTHTNYNPLDSQANEIAVECKTAGVTFVDVGTNVNTSLLAIKHAQENDNVYACVGIHPGDINKVDINIAMGEIRTLLEENKRIVAIGETGLDYHYEGYNAEEQRRVFIEHIRLAIKYHLPLMVHIRDAHEDAISILKQYAINIKVIIHCFTGNVDLVRQYVDLGYYISINGVITFNSASNLKEAIKDVPLDHLLSETDAP